MADPWLPQPQQPVRPGQEAQEEGHCEGCESITDRFHKDETFRRNLQEGNTLGRCWNEATLPELERFADEADNRPVATMSKAARERARIIHWTVPTGSQGGHHAERRHPMQRPTRAASGSPPGERRVEAGPEGPQGAGGSYLAARRQAWQEQQRWQRSAGWSEQERTRGTSSSSSWWTSQSWGWQW